MDGRSGVGEESSSRVSDIEVIADPRVQSPAFELLISRHSRVEHGAWQVLILAAVGEEALLVARSTLFCFGSFLKKMGVDPEL